MSRILMIKIEIVSRSVRAGRRGDGFFFSPSISVVV